VRALRKLLPELVGQVRLARQHLAASAAARRHWSDPALLDRLARDGAVAVSLSAARIGTLRTLMAPVIADLRRRKVSIPRIGGRFRT
jgi:hypothetical protein